MFVPLLLLVLSILTHFVFLGYPPEVVFDEVHIGFYLSNYWHGTYFVDVHPPLAKLILAIVGSLAGAASNVSFANIGNSLPESILALRLLPLFAGTVLPLLIYGICRNFQIIKLVSVAVALLVIMENSLIAQSRFIIVDMFMLVFGFLSIWLYTEGQKLWRSHGLRALILISSALSAAAAFSVKWTGLAFIFLILFLEAYRLYQESDHPSRLKCFLRFSAVFVGILIVFYTALFAVHFKVLPYSGNGDPYMSARFQKGIIGSKFENDPNLRPLGFMGKFFEINLEMWRANQRLTTPHPYSSKWYTWPIMERTIYFWQGKNVAEDIDKKAHIYLLGNPVIYWLGTASIATFLITLLWLVAKRHLSSIPPTRRKFLFFVCVGFLANYLPFVFIGRIMFLYHYEAALVFSVMAIGLLLDSLDTHRKKIVAVTVVLGLAFAAYIFFAPLTYGLPLSESELQSRMWLKSWR